MIDRYQCQNFGVPQQRDATIGPGVEKRRKKIQAANDMDMSNFPHLFCI